MELDEEDILELNVQNDIVEDNTNEGLDDSSTSPSKEYDIAFSPNEKQDHIEVLNDVTVGTILETHLSTIAAVEDRTRPSTSPMNLSKKDVLSWSRFDVSHWLESIKLKDLTGIN